MHSQRCWALAAVLFLLAQGGRPTASSQVPFNGPPVGDALIVGRVISETGQPVAAAIVTLTGPSDSTASIALARSVLASPRGDFLFRDLAPGSYSLTSSKGGWMDGAYARRRPDGLSKPLVVKPSDILQDVTLRMWRRAAITGTVTDASGAAVVGGDVTLWHREDSGFSRLVSRASVKTDDRGVYRFSFLPPDDYLVGVVSTSITAPLDAVARVATATNEASLDPWSRELVKPIAEIALPVGALRFKSGLATTSATAVTGETAYPTTFYPGVTDTRAATLVRAKSGEEIAGVDIRLVDVPARRVTGRLVPNDGQSVSAIGITLIPADSLSLNVEAAATLTDQTGAFTLLGVVPGMYRLRAAGRRTSPLSVTTFVLQPGAPVSAARGSSFGERTITVGASDLDVTLDVAPASSIVAHMAFDGSKPPPAPADLVRLSVMLEPATETAGGSIIAPADKDGRVVFGSLSPGDYFLRVAFPPAGWELRSATVGARDIADAPISVSDATIDNLLITFSDHMPAVTGRVANRRDASEFANVLLFPADESQWTAFGARPRRLRNAIAEADGGFRFTALPPGDYFAIAVIEEDSVSWRTADRMRQLARSATRVVVNDGANAALTLTLQAVPR